MPNTTKKKVKKLTIADLKKTKGGAAGTEFGSSEHGGVEDTSKMKGGKISGGKVSSPTT